MKKLHVKATFIEPVLGTWPANPNVAREFIASKSPDAATIEDEVAALGPDAVADKGMTVFPRDPDGNPIFYDYQIKGMFKDACGMLSRIGGKTETGKKKAVNESGKLTAYKKVIDGLIFIQPRMIPILTNGEITECQRPLRAQTAQGILGCYLVLTEYDDDGNMLWAKMARVDGSSIRENVYYTLKNGEFAEAEP